MEALVKYISTLQQFHSLGVYSEKRKKKDINSQRYTPMFIAALFTIAKICKQSVFTIRQMDKEDMGGGCSHIYIYTEEFYSLLSHQIEQNSACAAMLMDLENIMLSEISQRKTNTIWFHLHVESKNQNKWMYIAKQKQIQRYTKHMTGYQWGERKAKGWDGVWN